MSFESLTEIRDALQTSGLPVRELHAIWEQRQPIPDPAQKKGEVHLHRHHLGWLQEDLGLARLLTARALERGEYLLASDAAREVLRLWPTATDEQRRELLGVRMDLATALLRLGMTQAARRELEPCLDERHAAWLTRGARADLLMQLGHIVREESHQIPERAARVQAAEEALGFYRQAAAAAPERLEATVFVAASALIIGGPGSALREEARALGAKILRAIASLPAPEREKPETAWWRAVAHTVLGEPEEAAAVYRAMSGSKGASTSMLAEARYRARFLAEALGLSRDYFKTAFPALQLVVFAGHLPNRPGAPGPGRFPPELREVVRAQLREQLARDDVRVGLVSAAAGADLLFTEALLDRQGEVHLILPWSREEFRQASVLPFEPEGAPVWDSLFQRALREADTVRELGQAYEPSSDVGWSYTTEVMAGLALHAARVARLDLKPMALSDGQPGRAGGTQAFVEFWRQHLGEEPLILPMPSAAPIGLALPHARGPVRPRCERPIVQQQVKSMLFADIVGYSKLTEKAIPDFISVFLERVSNLGSTTKYTPRSVNTWGDAIYAVFDFAYEAGGFALELNRMIHEGREDWLRKGLSWTDPADDERHPLNIRIGLHTGPVFMHYDPIVRRLGFTGAHVNRAARIEPVTKPGQIYASEEFAALAELEAEIRRRGLGGTEGDQASFVCEYAGTMELAKGYPGRYRIYRVVKHRVLALEELAKVTHDSYRAEAHARGETPASNAALQPWETLPEDLRDANRAQVADIPNKLRLLGYELTAGPGLPASALAISDEQLETLSIREHDRWARNRERQGWSYAPVRDEARKHHPLLVPWAELSEVEREKDRQTVRNLPMLIERAGFRLLKLTPG